jgi:hypothetical protein
MRIAGAAQKKRHKIEEMDRGIFDRAVEKFDS